jgi:hypothetical protein
MHLERKVKGPCWLRSSVLSLEYWGAPESPKGRRQEQISVVNSSV